LNCDKTTAGSWQCLKENSQKNDLAQRATARILWTALVSYLAWDIDTLENVQRWATNLSLRIVWPNYLTTQELVLYSLYCQWQWGDIIETYKLLHGYYDVNWSRYFTLSSVDHTRGHQMKLFKTHHVLF